MKPSDFILASNLKFFEKYSANQKHLRAELSQGATHLGTSISQEIGGRREQIPKNLISLISLDLPDLQDSSGSQLSNSITHHPINNDHYYYFYSFSCVLLLNTPMNKALLLSPFHSKEPEAQRD